MNKYKKLALSLVLDACGYISFVFPPFDIAWAPFSAYLMTRLYKGRRGKIAAVIAFIEEALPGLDVIPTFTIMWFLTYVFQKEEEPIVVEVEAEDV